MGSAAFCTPVLCVRASVGWDHLKAVVSSQISCNDSTEEIVSSAAQYLPFLNFFFFYYKCNHIFGAVLGNQIFFFSSVLETCKCSVLCARSTEIDETGQTFEVVPFTNNSVFCTVIPCVCTCLPRGKYTLTWFCMMGF